VSYIDDLIKQVRDHDAARPRSVQSAVGWSEVGGCRAYLGFRLADAWPSDDTDTWAAQRGTAIHEYLEKIAAAPGVRVEVDTEYRGIPGHADIVGPDWVGDFKTTSLASSRMWAASPDVMLQKRIQAHGYAAGLVDAGELPGDATVRLIVIPVDGTFADWWALEEPFDRSLADMGADRLESVRELMAAGEPLPKDMPWTWCQSWCQFVSVCRDTTAPESETITDPELVAAVARYGETTQTITRLYKEKDGLAEQIRGLRGTAGDWRISLSKPGESKTVPDEGAIAADYAARGEPVPLTTKAGNAPRLNVTLIKRKADK
jgi:hypothetical protein